MSLIIFDNHASYYKPIGGSRVEPSGLNRDGRPVVPQQWECPRCGQDVDNDGGHLIVNAPCRDCRAFLREEYGDETRYSKRQKPLEPAPVFESWPADDATVSLVRFPLTVIGHDLLDLYVGDWAA